MNASSEQARSRIEDLRRDTEHRRLPELAAAAKGRTAAGALRRVLDAAAAWFARSQLGPGRQSGSSLDRGGR